MNLASNTILKACGIPCIVVTHDHRTLDVFDRILDVEDGTIQIRAGSPASSP
jgi:ABC-type lipoprotein export system ATPase subunit